MIDEISTHSAVNFQALFIRWSVVNVLFKTALDCFLHRAVKTIMMSYIDVIQTLLSNYFRV